MKTILILLIAGYAFAGHETASVQGPIADILKIIMDKIRNAIPEPIEIEELDLTLPENFLISGSLNVTNLAASGLKNFTFKYIIISSFKMGLEQFTLDTKYTMDLPLLKIPLLSLFGNGTVRIVVSNVDIDGVIDLGKVKSGKSLIKSFNVDMKNIEFYISGVFDDDELSTGITDFINTNTIKVFHKYKTNISEFIRNTLNKVIEDLIHRNKTSSVYEVADIGYGSGYSWSLWKGLYSMLESLLREFGKNEQRRPPGA